MGGKCAMIAFVSMACNIAINKSQMATVQLYEYHRSTKHRKKKWFDRLFLFTMSVIHALFSIDIFNLMQSKTLVKMWLFLAHTCCIFIRKLKNCFSSWIQQIFYRSIFQHFSPSKNKPNQCNKLNVPPPNNNPNLNTCCDFEMNHFYERQTNLLWQNEICYLHIY